MLKIRTILKLKNAQLPRWVGVVISLGVLLMLPGGLAADGGAGKVTYPKRFIAHVEPRVMGPGTLFTIRGEGFGTSGTVVSFGDQPCEVVRWTDRAIVARAPTKPGSGTVTFHAGYPVEVNALYVPCSVMEWKDNVITARTPKSLDDGKIFTVWTGDEPRVTYDASECYIEDKGDDFYYADCAPLMSEVWPIRVDFLTDLADGRIPADWEMSFESPYPVTVSAPTAIAFPQIDNVPGGPIAKMVVGEETHAGGKGFGAKPGMVVLNPDWRPDLGDAGGDPWAAEVTSWDEYSIHFVVPEACLGKQARFAAVIGGMFLQVPPDKTFQCVEPNEQ